MNQQWLPWVEQGLRLVSDQVTDRLYNHVGAAPTVLLLLAHEANARLARAG